MKNILVADDDRVHVQLVTARLRRQGFNVRPAFDAMQAWMLASRIPLDAIILDINMPGGTGFEVLRKLKASIKTSLIPVVVVSGTIGAQDEEKIREMGADDFLPKPLDIDALLASLQELVSGR